jgi:SAM-dependent methyltransferase
MSQDLFERLSAVIRLRLVVGLTDLGLMDVLHKPRSLAFLCNRFAARPHILRGIMRFLAMDESLVRQVKRDSFISVLTENELNLLSIHVRKFVDAYGSCIEHVGEVVTGAASGAHYVREDALADAFNRVSVEHQAINDAILQSKPTFLVELGCGAGNQLAWVGNHLPDLELVGVDSSAAMCRAAAARLSAAGLRNRAKIIHCDAKNVRKELSSAIRGRADLIYGKSLLNAQFRDGRISAIRFLGELSKAFPDRKFICVDYYGELFANAQCDRANSQGILQDVVQLLSNQGTPPSSVDLWAKIYSDAGCQLIHADNGSAAGIRWFIHHVRLGTSTRSASLVKRKEIRSLQHGRVLGKRGGRDSRSRYRREE